MRGKDPKWERVVARERVAVAKGEGVASSASGAPESNGSGARRATEPPGRRGEVSALRDGASGATEAGADEENSPEQESQVEVGGEAEGAGDDPGAGAGAGEGEVAGESFSYREMVIGVLRGPYRGREFTFTADRVTLGKSPQNDIPLPDETVSREHVEIRREGRGYLLRDLGSTNGTFLDGAEIREAYLRTGSQVTVGETRFRFRAVRRQVAVEPYPEEELEGLVGRSLAVRLAFGLARAVAPLDLTVLLEGEPGTGRRSLATAIHRLSPHSDAPLAVVDCVRASPERLERHLFQPATGVLERFAGGTVVLLEPWEVPPALQVRLATAIRDRRRGAGLEVGGVGGGVGGGAGGGATGSEQPAPQRFIGLTSRPLQDEVERGRLEPTLRDVLQRVRIRLPPLRERLDDVSLLAARFVAQAAPFSPPVGEAVVELVSRLAGALPLERNVQSLRELVQALLVLELGPALHALGGTALDDDAFDPALSFGQSKTRAVESFEKRYVRWLLTEHDGNVSKAARAAEMDRKHLHRLLKRHGLR